MGKKFKFCAWARPKGPIKCPLKGPLKWAWASMGQWIKLAGLCQAGLVDIL